MHLNDLESFALSKLLQSGCAVADEVVAAVRVPVVHLDPDHDGGDGDDGDDLLYYLYFYSFEGTVVITLGTT